MKHSYIHDDHNCQIPNRARGYKLTETGAPETSDIPIVLVGHSHLFTTLEDLALWLQALQTQRLLEPELMARAYQTGQLDSGAKHTYGFGWYEEQRKGRPVLVHSGTWYGFLNYVCQYLEERVAIAVLSNNESLAGEKLVDRLAEDYFRDAV